VTGPCPRAKGGLYGEVKASLWLNRGQPEAFAFREKLLQETEGGEIVLKTFILKSENWVLGPKSPYGPQIYTLHPRVDGSKGVGIQDLNWDVQTAKYAFVNKDRVPILHPSKWFKPVTGSTPLQKKNMPKNTTEVTAMDLFA
jgi:hypothetical protein